MIQSGPTGLAKTYKRSVNTSTYCAQARAAEFGVDENPIGIRVCLKYCKDVACSRNAGARNRIPMEFPHCRPRLCSLVKRSGPARLATPSKGRAQDAKKRADFWPLLDP